MKALITGAGGFVGAHLCRTLLAAGHEVTAIVSPTGETWRLDELRNDARIVPLDLRVPEEIERRVEELRPEWVFHLAAHGAYSWQRDAERIMQTNLVGTVHLLETCRRIGVQAFVNAGSSSEYGFKDHAPSEDEMVDPNSDYAVMKAASALHLRFVAQRDDMHAVTLRLYSVFGPWEEPGRLMPTLVARGLEGTLPPLVAPDTPRDFVSARDVDRAFLMAAEATDLPRGTILNIASGKETLLREVVELARAEMGITAQPEWGTEPQRDWDAKVWVGDPRRAKEQLGWEADDDVATGFRTLADWLRERPELWERFGVRAALQK